MKRVALIATGGTIAGVAPSATQALGYRAGALDVSALIAVVPQLAELAEVVAQQPFSIDSAAIRIDQWRLLADRVGKAAADPSIDGIVVLHGTDTLEETAFFLHLVHQGPKPLVLTGAMRPASALGADGPMNVYHAVSAAAHPACRDLGAVIVFGDILLSARGLQKRDSVPGAFNADQYGRLGLVKGRDVFVYQRPTRAHGGLATDAALPAVAVLHAYADMPARLIDAAAEGSAGLVFAGVGNGNLRADWCAALAAAAARGVAVVRASRVPNGTVVRGGEVDDDRMGFVTADNLGPLQARILLMLGLAHGHDRARLQALFDRY